MSPHWRILCYHAIPKQHIDSFHEQLTALCEMGYRFVGFDDSLQILNEGVFGYPIMTVTFDDGDATIFENALQVLDELRIKAFLYVSADYIRKGTTYRDDKPLPALSWQQLRQWVDLGHGIGSHTLTHAPLRLCSDSRLLQECSESKAILEDHCQIPIRHLSYPWGQHSKRTYAFLKERNLYDSIATIDRGQMVSGHDPLKLRRDVCSPSTKADSMLRTMQMADRCYWLRYFRRRPNGYWTRHPEEEWAELEGVHSEATV